MPDHPTLIISADTADAVLTTVECPECGGDFMDEADLPWGSGSDTFISVPAPCPSCTAGRVPAPDALRRLVYPDRPTVPCPTCVRDGKVIDLADEAGCPIYCPTCGSPNDRGLGVGVVPLVGGMTVKLAVEECRLVCDESKGWMPDCGDTSPTRTHYDRFEGWRTDLHERRQRVVAVAQVADVIEEWRIQRAQGDWSPWRENATQGDLDRFMERLRAAGIETSAERRWVVVLGRVDPCEETA